MINRRTGEQGFQAECDKSSEEGMMDHKAEMQTSEKLQSQLACIILYFFNCSTHLLQSVFTHPPPPNLTFSLTLPVVWVQQLFANSRVAFHPNQPFSIGERCQIWISIHPNHSLGTCSYLWNCLGTEARISWNTNFSYVTRLYNILTN